MAIEIQVLITGALTYVIPVEETEEAQIQAVQLATQEVKHLENYNLSVGNIRCGVAALSEGTPFPIPAKQ